MAKQEFQIENEYPYNRTGPLRWILSHLRRYPLLPLALVAGAIANNFAYSTIQVFVGRAFDVIRVQDFEMFTLLIPVIGIVASAAGQGVTGILRNFSVGLLAQKVEKNSREELYASLLGKSQTFHGRQRIGDIMARATNDVHMLNMMFSPGLMLIIDSALALVIPVIMIALIDPALLLVPLIFTGLLVLTVADYTRRLKPVSIAQREQFGLMNAGLTEAVAGIEVVKANVRERYEWDKFTGNARQFREYFVQAGIIQARYLPMLMFSLCWGAGLLHALLLWRSGAITLGNVVAFMGLFGTLRFTTFISIFSFNLVQLGMASAERILNMIIMETELDENREGIDQEIRGEVEFQGVSFDYDGATVLEDISFRVDPGQTVAIVGQTGSGKTTLTRLINRIFDTTAGRVMVDGRDVREWSLEALRSQISTIEQDVFLFSRTLRENIAFGCAEASQEQIEQAAREAQADEFIRSFPEGYDTVIGERGVTLSGGQKQRVAIARAFLTNPKILILDDSTSAIDSATEDQIQRAMRRISSERTTFIITHRLSQIRWADRILVLDKGKLIDQGTHDELLERSPAYRRIFPRHEQRESHAIHT
ncbi:MAG: ABC transporter ATP-binding protein [Spirochaetaceae bacterium]|nr:MAG: ABC transporter ATP-binding protein [Spirochaetaceae bacterium]